MDVPKSAVASSMNRRKSRGTAKPHSPSYLPLLQQGHVMPPPKARFDARFFRIISLYPLRLILTEKTNFCNNFEQNPVAMSRCNLFCHNI